MNRLQLLLPFLVFGGALFAQPALKFFTSYADADNNNRTEFYTVISEESGEGSCFAVVREVFTLEGELILSEGGLADCQPKNGKYGVKMNSEKTNLWVSFSEDGSGYLYIDIQKADLTTQRYRSTLVESIEEPYDPYTDQEYTDGEEGTYEQEPDLYLSADGAQFYLVSLDGYFAFAIIGSTNENCETNDIDGTLLMDESGDFYTFSDQEGCDVFRIELINGQLILTEGQCKNVHGNGCASWAGTYDFYNPELEPDYMDIEGSGEPIYYDDEEPINTTNEDLYLREDGMEFHLKPSEDLIEFEIISNSTESCNNNSVNGVLGINSAGSYFTYTNDTGCEVFRVELKEDRLILKEAKCKNVHGKDCVSWSGEYLLYIE